MALDTAQTLTRSNSDLSAIEVMANDTSIDPAARMQLIYWQVMGWHKATEGSVGRFGAVKGATRVRPALARLNTSKVGK